MAFGFGKKWWKRVSGISAAQRKLSRKLGVRLSDGLPTSSRRSSSAKDDAGRPRLYTLCPNCGVKINYTERSIGTVRRCPGCGQKVLLCSPEEKAGFPCAYAFGGACALVVLIGCGFCAVGGLFPSKPAPPPLAQQAPSKEDAATVNPPPKPPPTALEESDAAAQLRYAKMLIEAHDAATARQKLQKILDDYPDTKAAPEARELLKTLDK